MEEEKLRQRLMQRRQVLQDTLSSVTSFEDSGDVETLDPRPTPSSTSWVTEADVYAAPEDDDIVQTIQTIDDMEDSAGPSLPARRRRAKRKKDKPTSPTVSEHLTRTVTPRQDDVSSVGATRGSSEESLQTPPTREKSVKKIESMEELVSIVAPKLGSISSSEKMGAKSAEAWRKKIQSRVQKAKEKAEHQTTSDSRSRTRLKYLREKSLTTTRFDEALAEDAGMDSAVKDVLERRQKEMKAMMREAKGVSSVPTADEAYDFFTKEYEASSSSAELPLYPSLSSTSPTPRTKKSWLVSDLWRWMFDSGRRPRAPPDAVARPDVEAPEEQAGTSASPGTRAQHEEDDSESKEQQEQEISEVKEEALVEMKKGKISSHDLIPSVTEWEQTQWQIPHYVTSDIRGRWENDAYFVPSVLPVSDDKKIPNMWPHNPEEEGLYVGPKPPITWWNKNKIEHRLLTEKSFRFFGEDAEVFQYPEPVHPICFHPGDLNENERIFDDIATSDRVHARTATTDQVSRFQLDINIGSITFTHHHLFSTEHVLVSKLRSLCTKYAQQSQKDVVPMLTARLSAVKSAVSNALVAADEDVGSENLIQDQEVRHRLETYVREIRQLRRQKDEEEFVKRSLLKSILQTWKQLKDLRDRQGYTNTSLKLQINKVDSNLEEDEREWKKAIDDEVNEARLLYEVSHRLYPRQSPRKKKKKAKKKKKKRRKHRDDDEQSLEESEEEDDELTKEESSLCSLPDFEAKETKRAVEQKAMESKRQPGEPKLYPVLTQTAVLTDESHLPRSEQYRRKHVNRLKITLRILLNWKEACRTKPRFLSPDFVVKFGQIFNLQILQKPEVILVQIYESSSWNISTPLLAEVYVPSPNNNVTAATVEMGDHEFSSVTPVKHEHAGVGSGIAAEPSLTSITSETLMTSGFIRCSAAWGVSSEGKVMAPFDEGQEETTKLASRSSSDAIAAIGAAGIVNMNRLRSWLQEARIDPNDPANSAFLHLLKPETASSPQQPAYFRLDQLQEEFNFATDEQIANNPRFRLLQLRDKEVPEFQNYTMVPLREREIPHDIFQAYDKRLAEEQAPLPEDDVDAHKAKIQKYISKVREQVMRRHRIMQHQKTLESIIVEEQVPDISTLSLKVLNLAEPYRPLRPIRKERKKAPSQFTGVPDVNILVNIVRGFNIPVRGDNEPFTYTKRRLTAASQPSHSPQKLQLPQVQVRPYIEVSFQRTVAKTSVAEGPNPTWNQNLSLPLNLSSHDLSSTNLQKVRDVLYLNVFDEVRVDILDDERDRDVRVHERIEQRWLGSLRIPFTTLYFNSRIEGTFKLDMPPVLLGYSWKPSASSFYLDTAPLNPNTTYVSLFITVDPPLASPEVIAEKFDSEDPPALQTHAEKWLGASKRSFPDRLVKTSVISVQGLSVFVTRFIKPLNPPTELFEQNMDIQQKMNIVARFVSLIPHHSECIFLPGIIDIWATGDQLLEMLSGTEDEHAILLCNYFLYLNEEAWLLLGFAVPEGRTAHVLTKENGNYFVWRATTGEKFSVRDNFSPLISADCLINQQNVWSNIQQHSHPSRVSFDVQKSNLWSPIFSRSFPSPSLPTVQPDQLVYATTSDGYVRSLQERIERTIREQLMSWRSRHRTPWNRHCNQALKKILPKLEKTRCQSTEDKETLLEELYEFLATYEVCGFPISLPYTDLESLSEAVYATGVHTTTREDVEFSLAVYVHPYPNNIVAVWIYVASLFKR